MYVYFIRKMCNLNKTSAFQRPGEQREEAASSISTRIGVQSGAEKRNRRVNLVDVAVSYIAVLLLLLFRTTK